MAKTRVVVNLIDADGCTYNLNYRQRLLQCIRKHRHIIEENALKHSLTTGQKELLDCYMANVLLEEQENFSIQDDEYQSLLAEMEQQARIFDKSRYVLDDDKRLGRFIYYFVEYMEKIFDDTLRVIFVLANTILIDAIGQQKEKGDDVSIMLGSNRQSHPYDKLNSRDRGTASIYKDIDRLARIFDVKLDKFTLADMRDIKHHSGRSFEKILEGNPSSLKNIFDDSKVNILYAACHRVASKNKKQGAEIVINMWDDNEEILTGLKAFYSAHTELLPKGLKLNLIKYDGEIRRTEIIEGTGVIDKNYKKNTVLMATLCGYDAEKSTDAINIAKKLDVAAFLQKRSTTKEKKVNIKDLSLFKDTKETTSQAIIPYPAATF